MLLGGLVDFCIVFRTLLVLSEFPETCEYCHTNLALVNFDLPILWLHYLLYACILSIFLLWNIFSFFFALVILI